MSRTTPLSMRQARFYVCDFAATDRTQVHTQYYAPAPEPEYSAQPFCLHYVPPSAISTRYYALSDPNVYPTSTTVPTVAPAAMATPPAPTPPAPSPTPSTSSLAATTPESRAVPVASSSHVLPKHRRNTDDPGGGPAGTFGHLLVAPAFEVGSAPLCLGQNWLTAARAGTARRLRVAAVAIRGGGRRPIRYPRPRSGGVGVGIGALGRRRPRPAPADTPGGAVPAPAMCGRPVPAPAPVPERQLRARSA